MSKRPLDAVEQHSRQAAQFVTRYERLRHWPHESCFTYSRHRLDAWLQALLPDPARGRRALDVGCGTGHHLAELRDRGFDPIGVDGSREMLLRARAADPAVPLQQADAAHLPFPDASFDLVFCIEVLRYLPVWRPCLSEIARVLKPGGTCLATAAPLLSLNGYWLVNRIAHAVPVGGLVRLKQYFGTSSRVRREFAAAGFAGVVVHGVYLGPLNWVERAAPRLLPPLLRRWERADRLLADRPPWRELSNMFVVQATRRRPMGEAER
jgi:ubiquinone/menaquinone biosynthesis C-methylase UbiE